jgi:hypothetical protein
VSSPTAAGLKPEKRSIVLLGRRVRFFFVCLKAKPADNEQENSIRQSNGREEFAEESAS